MTFEFRDLPAHDDDAARVLGLWAADGWTVVSVHSETGSRPRRVALLRRGDQLPGAFS